MEEEFVTYEQALALKELGFNEDCFGWYDSNKNLYMNIQSKQTVLFHNKLGRFNDSVIAPTKSQLFRWFREKYDLHSYVFAWLRRVGWGYDIPNESSTFIQTDDNTFTTYEEAENACVDKLIEIAKKKTNELIHKQ
jgi:hypothetical protein